MPELQVGSQQKHPQVRRITCSICHIFWPAGFLCIWTLRHQVPRSNLTEGH